MRATFTFPSTSIWVPLIPLTGGWSLINCSSGIFIYWKTWWGSRFSLLPSSTNIFYAKKLWMTASMTKVSLCGIWMPYSSSGKKEIVTKVCSATCMISLSFPLLCLPLFFPFQLIFPSVPPTIILIVPVESSLISALTCFLTNSYTFLGCAFSSSPFFTKCLRWPLLINLSISCINR